MLASTFGAKAMIHDYTNHSANERTFLAWVRTGIAVVAFGFVVEKFNLFLLTIARTAIAGGQSQLRLDKLAGSFGRYEGLALILGGVGLILLATVRFARTTQMLDDPEAHTASSVRTELIVSAALVVLIASYSIYLAFE
jgi:putative membrane protein